MQENGEFAWSSGSDAGGYISNNSTSGKHGRGGSGVTRISTCEARVIDLEAANCITMADWE